MTQLKLFKAKVIWFGVVCSMLMLTWIHVSFFQSTIDYSDVYLDKNYWLGETSMLLKNISEHQLLFQGKC